MSVFLQTLIKKYIDDASAPVTGSVLTFNLGRTASKGIFYDTAANRNEMFVISTFGEQGVLRSINSGKTWSKVFQRDSVTGINHKGFYRNEVGHGFIWTSGGNFCRTTPSFAIAETFTDMYAPLSMTNGIDQKPGTGLIMFAEYSGAGGIDGKRIWKTIDNGATWAVAHEDLGIGHWHSLQRDPYTGHWYACSGDANAGVKIIRSTDDGVTWVVLASGSQEFRNIGFGFSKTHLMWCPDYASAPSGTVKLYKIKREHLLGDWEANREIISSTIEGPSYGIIKTKDGRFCFCTPAESREQSCIYITDGVKVKKILTTDKTPDSILAAPGFLFVSKPDYNNKILVEVNDCDFRNGSSVYVANLPIGIDL